MLATQVGSINKVSSFGLGDCEQFIIFKDIFEISITSHYYS